jgi:DNA-binding MarR family transcriptional regulator
MDDELKQDLLHALFCFKKSGRGVPFPAELSALGCIDRCGNEEQTAHHAMHETLSVSKAAVSQMLGSLEKRGFILRETDRDNRRRIIITVTKKGKSSINKGQKHLDGFDVPHH